MGAAHVTCRRYQCAAGVEYLAQPGPVTRSTYHIRLNQLIRIYGHYSIPVTCLESAAKIIGNLLSAGLHYQTAEKGKLTPF